MKSLIQNLKQNIRKLYEAGMQKSRLVLRFIRRVFQSIAFYFRTHRKVRLLTFILIPPLFFAFVFVLAIWSVTPGKQELSNIQNQVASEVYSADSVLMGRYFLQDRTEVKFEDIAPVVVDALIATEDVRFYEHEGVDYASLGRVLVKSIFMGDESAGGGSTLTQQLAKNLYPRKRFKVLSIVVNKLREGIIANRLEKIYSKEELITLYLNTVPFSDNAFGIEAAATRFFSTSAKNLTADQAAVLIGMLKATHSYNPRLFPDRAELRRNTVLAQMGKYNFLDEAAVDTLKSLPLQLEYSNITHHQGLAPYFRETLKMELLAWCKNHTKEDGTPYNLYTDGLKIYTTIDSKMQAYAEKAVAQQLEEVQKQFFEHWGTEKPWKGKEHVVQEAIYRTSRYRQLKQQGLSEEAIMTRLRHKVTTTLFTWEGEKEAEISPIDSIMHHLQYLNAGFVVMEPSTGQVKAWVGGINHDFFQYDHVKVSTKRQVGSIFKPIVYAMAIEQGVSPCELVSAGQETYIDEEGEKWTPRNMQNDYQVEYSMRGALAYSVNTVAVKTIQRAGVINTIDLARRMGISSVLPTVPSIALGSSSVSLLEMTSAYACLANDGVAAYPYSILAIADQYGNVFNDFVPKESGKQALSKETTQLVKQLLRTVVHEGTASRLRWRYGIYNDIAGKTGTTQANADGWFMAITPTLAMGAWVGADDPRIRFRSTKLGQGSNTALPIVGYFMKQVNEDNAYKTLREAKFQPLPYALQQQLNCDLYELNEDLQLQIIRMVHQRDSVLNADSLAVLPDESFLEMLFKRKMKILQAQQQRDSLQINLQISDEVIGG